MTGPIRYGVIGTGMMGIEHIDNIRALPDAQVSAIADPYPPSLAAGVKALEGREPPATFENHRELIASGLCDAVVIASPNMTHIDILRDVLDSDLHVLVEKPLCTTVDDCRWVVEAQSRRDAVLWVGMEYRYMPPTARLIAEVRSGAAGELKMLAIREHRFPFLEKVNDWNRFNHNSGGTLVEKCCHHFDLMNLIIGSSPTRIYASGSQAVNHLDERYEGRRPDILDNAYVIVDYEGGRRAMLDLCMFAEGGENQEELVAVGDRGKVEARLPSGLVFIGSRDGEWFSPTIETATDGRIVHTGSHHGASYIEHLEFLSAIRNGTPPQVNARDGLLAVAMGVAAQRSIEKGCPVDLAEVLDNIGSTGDSGRPTLQGAGSDIVDTVNGERRRGLYG